MRSSNIQDNPKRRRRRSCWHAGRVEPTMKILNPPPTRYSMLVGGFNPPNDGLLTWTRQRQAKWGGAVQCGASEMDSVSGVFLGVEQDCSGDEHKLPPEMIFDDFWKFFRNEELDVDDEASGLVILKDEFLG
ncbi:hypothetical protein TIFTF001_027299 [Ficus carica]|uniref:Uncharacterized protein n=1 Tax=Ficus carica TaxID=3494 RepID=A0AA88J026_FICCA|nr:hypothetical protein TIFTF001_027299 [Ficus carica]